MYNTKIINLAEKYISKYNTGKKNPYHNNQHMLFVRDMCMKIFDDYLSKNKMSELAIDENKLILNLAALFHDFDHFGKPCPDIENIKKAVEGFKTFYHFSGVNELSSFIYNSIISVIEATEFPHKPISDKAILIHIIRDADTIGGIYDGWQEVVRNICKEMNKSVEYWIPIQHKFISNITYKTDYAKQLYSERRKAVLSDLLRLK